MATRRGHGEGSISKRSDGRWHVRVDLGRGLKGQRRTKHAYAATEADAIQQLRDFGGRAATGDLLSTSTPTVATFLEQWFRLGLTPKGKPWRESTKRSYRDAIDRYLVPAFGPVRLEQLSPLAVQDWLAQHVEQHGARRRVTLAHAILRSALSAARRLQVVPHNVAQRVIVETPIARPITALDIDQAAAFLTIADEHRLGALFSVALACGLRLGEATGLLWADINLDTGELTLRQQLQLVPVAKGSKKRRLHLVPLKTATSRRTLVLPDVCVQTLRAYRKQQLEDRLKAGTRWTETGLVFTTYDARVSKKNPGGTRSVGTGLHPRNVLRTLHTLLAAAGLPRMRFHELRHSAASLLIAEGVELVEISKLLGHSDIRITANLYGHLLKQTAVKAARIMDTVLRPSGAKAKR